MRLAPVTAAPACCISSSRLSSPLMQVYGQHPGDVYQYNPHNDAAARAEARRMQVGGQQPGHVYDPQKDAAARAHARYGGMSMPKTGEPGRGSASLSTSRSFSSVNGGTLYTWKPDLDVEQVQVDIHSEGRPYDAKIEQWQSADVPMKMRVYSEHGYERPFSAVIATPRDGSTIAIRNVGELEFPFVARVVEDVVEPSVECVRAARTLQGDGASRTYSFPYQVDRVQILLQSHGMPLKARIEVVQGPNAVRQVVELESNDGNHKPFLGLIDTPGPGTTIRVVNMSPMVYPLDASIVAHAPNQPTVPMQRTAREAAAREAEAREAEAAREHAAREQAAREQAAREYAAREHEAREYAAQQAALQAAQEQAARDQAALQAAREQVARDQAALQAARDQAAREQVAREHAAQQAAREQVAREQAQQQAAEVKVASEAAAAKAVAEEAAAKAAQAMAEAMAARLAADAAATSAAGETARAAAAPMSEYEQYLANRGSGNRNPAPPAAAATAAGETARAAAAPMSEYEAYMANRGSGNRNPAPAAAAPASAPTARDVAADTVSEYERYMASRGNANGGAVAPTSMPTPTPAAAPTAASASSEQAEVTGAFKSEYEKYMARRARADAGLRDEFSEWSSYQKASEAPLVGSRR
jgi:hypothetical protein